ncbi:YgfY-like protein [Glarea lozoyensis ATCC 20868]|uniref:Succinate dehydrogenase assembly factor 2, mitochondrial n=1 Tax=Glarea lozoyensis (strain ATCC 20868 / MF5171) TaxID=1116229 RepID=S3CUZ1_GLAL2|nr:YgfY-like protein [Glarea lozoyensis ATCC 20868]EPE29470.1 YgfY-like protein [Glarea lozoyensis ATCC 20868]
MAFRRPISMTARRMAGPGNAQQHEGTEEHRKIQTEKPLNPHMTNTNSTIANEMPSVGKQKAPPELITSVDGDFVPKDSVPENTERMTGGTQKGEPESGENADMKIGESGSQTDGEIGVGEMEGAKFKVEPLRRTGEDANTMRARLLYQSRKRGTLESDLLMSTFAEAHLRDMTVAQMAQFDLFLDENDWDIYYWATQEPSPTSRETAEGAGGGPEGATLNARGIDKNGPKLETDEWRQGKPRSGEWAQTVGTFKPAYRPVPARWKNSEILGMLRRHVISRSAGGVLEGTDVGVDGAEQSMKGTGGGGMAFMPPVFETDRP